MSSDAINDPLTSQNRSLRPASTQQEGASAQCHLGHTRETKCRGPTPQVQDLASELSRSTVMLRLLLRGTIAVTISHAFDIPRMLLFDGSQLWSQRDAANLGLC